MKSNLRTSILAICTTGLLAGCMSEKIATGQGMCDPDHTERLIGLVNPSDRQIMDLTGATTVRRANEGQPMTMELIPFRATVIMDAESGEVTRANCS
ncbi:hypothetical protein SAMN05444149_10946 [Pseudosulfitobacter pseudonitzschiae]|uniref:Peptidase inhibitor I78 family protein n=1 Tax=Pseudosulfitobacter pseudonitzschiae TaxID=1402135 RepID=A0A073J939_9RHOB|nr:hypothetical protein [Pseudosulfitobacter pseudonitzschiae]KEJ94237.1 hypothetical protein SUH3_07600 [Pseudosulfitobacter pseudonitzschiae]QKS11038.1 hypothetical protein HT745_20845 [Pseudosulfitobacter pseudonitzschiae]SHG05653.1 hypothetical protein SAMN05444149_10946 [Pseudosulfitobacter pseudonitzschiae]